MGPTPSKGNEDENLCNAAGLPTSLITGASYFDSCTAFGMIRKGLLDITILGSLQVSENGDLKKLDCTWKTCSRYWWSNGFSTKSEAGRCCDESC